MFRRNPAAARLKLSTVAGTGSALVACCRCAGSVVHSGKGAVSNLKLAPRSELAEEGGSPVCLIDT